MCKNCTQNKLYLISSSCPKTPNPVRKVKVLGHYSTKLSKQKNKYSSYKNYNNYDNYNNTYKQGVS